MKRNLKSMLQWGVAPLVVLLVALGGCAKSTQIKGLSASVEELLADQNGNPVDTMRALGVVVSSDEQWKVSSNVSWLTTNAQMGGISRTVVGVKVQPNLSGQERMGVLTFATTKEQVEVRVKQAGGHDIDISTVQYEIPVIFHVLYNEEDKVATDTLRRKYVLNSTDAQRILEYVNELYGQRPKLDGNTEYRGVKRWSDPTSPAENYYMPKETNIRFVLATVDPKGNRISPAGVRAVAMPEKSLKPTDVMNDKSGGRFHSMAWPIKSYVNVFVFPFTREGDANQITLGISHLPFALSSAPIEGLAQLTPEDEAKIKTAGGLDGFSNYNHCVTINADAFDWLTWRYAFLRGNLGKNTIAHELGHYLGLYHTFSEVQGGNNTIILDSCEDTDHCADTKTYNRKKYEENRRSIIASGNTSVLEFAGLLKRNDCSSGRFEATNIMDYDYTHSDEFTPNQIARMRQVLYNSYTVPGIKVASPKSPMRSNAVPVYVEAAPRATSCAIHNH